MTARFTKKYMQEDYERLYDHAGLLELYLWDTQHRGKPDAKEHYRDKNCDVRVELWRGKAASGGYVVITESLSHVWYLDQAIALYQDNHSEHTLGIRTCLERMRIARNKMYAESLGRPLMETEQVYRE